MNPVLNTFPNLNFFVFSPNGIHYFVFIICIFILNQIFLPIHFLTFLIILCMKVENEEFSFDHEKFSFLRLVITFLLQVNPKVAELYGAFHQILGVGAFMQEPLWPKTFCYSKNWIFFIMQRYTPLLQWVRFKNFQNHHIVLTMHWKRLMTLAIISWLIHSQSKRVENGHE